MKNDITKETSVLKNIADALTLTNELILKNSHFSQLNISSLKDNLDLEPLMDKIKTIKSETSHGFIDDDMSNILNMELKDDNDLKVIKSLLETNLKTCLSYIESFLYEDKEKNDLFPVFELQTIYEMYLPVGSYNALNDYDKIQTKYEFSKKINKIPGFELTEYYLEDEQDKIMFTIEKGYDFDDIVKQVINEINVVRNAYEQKNLDTNSLSK